MPNRDKDHERRSRQGDGKTTARDRKPVRKGKLVETREAPFHGALHSEHPRDPFRDVFGASSMKFEF